MGTTGNVVLDNILDLFNIERKLNTNNAQSYAKDDAIARLLEGEI